MKDMLFMAADLWMIAIGFYFGLRLLRLYGNWLLGLEWMVVATSGTNFLLWALLGGDETSVLYSAAAFLDAFSRSVGITLILVLGLMRVTHLYKPSVKVEVGVFGLGIVAGLYLQQFSPTEFHAGPATFYVVVNVLTTIFLAYFAWRLWIIGAKSHALAVALVSAVACAVAVIYDFFPIPGDDAQHTIFYIIALSTWGSQMLIYYLAYRVMHEHNVATGRELEARPHSIAHS